MVIVRWRRWDIGDVCRYFLLARRAVDVNAFLHAHIQPLFGDELQRSGEFFLVHDLCDLTGYWLTHPPPTRIPSETG